MASDQIGAATGCRLVASGGLQCRLYRAAHRDQHQHSQRRIQENAS